MFKYEIYDEERALYGLENESVEKCTFAGPADGESALKESRNIIVKSCDFQLRYPLWHVEGLELSDSILHGDCRAAMWYAKDVKIQNCEIDGVKFMRECDRVQVENCRIVSEEIGWKSRELQIVGGTVVGAYAFFDSCGITITDLDFAGKYSFQYVDGLTLRDSRLDTKDAFWHSRNVLVENCIVAGEYLGWYSDGLTLVNCTITGTQPLCYCKNLRLIDCTMEGCDLAFEKSEVVATLHGPIASIKNPESGVITLDSLDDLGELIAESGTGIVKASTGR